MQRIDYAESLVSTRQYLHSRGVKPDLPVPRGISSVTFCLGGDEFLLLEFPLPAFRIPAGLTPSETAVTELLLLGGSVGEIAQLRKTSINTVRNQIRSVHAKLQISNVGELARLCSPRDERSIASYDLATVAV